MVSGQTDFSLLTKIINILINTINFSNLSHIYIYKYITIESLIKNTLIKPRWTKKKKMGNIKDTNITIILKIDLQFEIYTTKMRKIIKGKTSGTIYNK